MIFEALWDCGRYCEETALLGRACDGIDDGYVFLAADLSIPGPVIDRLIEARRNGKLVALYPVLVDPYEGAVADISAYIAGLPDVDARRSLLRSLGEDKVRVNGVALADIMPLDMQRHESAAFACKLADVMLFATEAERQRFQKLLGRELVRFSFLELPKPRSEHFAMDRSEICIYAPSMPRSRIAFTELALADWVGRVKVIAQGDTPDISCDTAVVVCPEWWRPIQAASIAAAGFRVVAPRMGGADERGHALIYTEFDARSLLRAVSAALIDPAPSPTLLALHSDPAKALQRHAVLVDNGPLVSVIVRTFDRPELLERALESIAAQTYHPIEAIVVNGGGADVTPRLERFRNRLQIIYVDAGRRTLISESSNLGARAASGEFIAYLDDDDVLYPDHVGRCTEALLRTGCDLVYTNCVAEYAEIEGSKKHVLNIKMFLDRDFDLDTLYVYNVAPIHSIVHRRDVFERFGRFDESLPVCDDWELWTRVAQGGAIIHVDHVTCEYSWRWDADRSGNMTLTHQQNFVQAHDRIYAQYAAKLVNRPSIISAQAAALTHLRDRAHTLELQPERARELLFGF